ncbi:hypothetical protein LAWI1_G005177 [Lachnellula willkommii]|uniref:Alpha-1,3-mannosyltransferase n=1 Tax=Lachnellula willkommii TaxID=215461 RepID=A0A559MD32_9HELO|nr:hypothetical protein LAWI1_G005177 [Lachnellula willkommii]
MPSNAQYDLLPRTSSDFDLDPTNEFKDKPRPRQRWGLARKFRRLCRICRPVYILVGLVILLLWQVLFNASYTNPPPFSIPPNEKVFIAANIIDGDLITGPWGKSLVDLVELIGKDRVFVSIYGGPTRALEELADKLECQTSLVSEELSPLDSDTIPRTTLPTGESRIKRIAYLAEVRNKALEPLQILLTKFDKVLFINDVFYSAEDAARLLWGTNVDKSGKSVYKAACGTDFVSSWKFYDTFATRDSEGYSIGVPIYPWFANEGDAISRKDVLAGRDAVRVKSCWGGMIAFDARYLQRDTSGFSIGAGTGTKSSRNTGDVSHAGDLLPPKIPLRFRSEPEPFWDSSECCLVHADIMALPRLPDYPKTTSKWDTGIYMNPYVRVSYDATTQKHINIAKRFERLFAIPQAIINHFAHMPVFNARRAELEGEIIKDRLWVSLQNDTMDAELERSEKEFGGEESTWQGTGVERRAEETSKPAKREIIGAQLGKDYWLNKGYYVDYNRTATRGAYCGVRQLLVVKEGKLKEGEGNWDNLLNELPPLGL